MQFKRSITVVDCHAEGEIGRVVVGGVLPPPGRTVFEKARYLEREADWLRKFLLNEPRGAGMAFANLIVPPTHPEADLGYIIMETVEYPPMSGSNTICTATVALETGIVPMVEPETRLTMEAPGGLVRIRARCRDGRCEAITFTNVPCFVLNRDIRLEVEGFGSVRADIVYGGMLYAFVDAADLGFGLRRDEARDLVNAGMRVTKAAIEQTNAVHPENTDIRGVTITCLVAPVETEKDRKVSRNAVVIQPGRLDRCPTGTATSARLALLHARGDIKPGELFENRSLIDTRFEAKIVSTTTVGPYAAVVPEVTGRGFVTGIYQYGLDPDDPFPEGFSLDDGSVV